LPRAGGAGFEHALGEKALAESRVIGVLLLALASAHSTAASVSFDCAASGAAESPPTSSPGAGTVYAEIDASANTMSIVASFSGLVGTTTAAHIHCCTATAGAGTAGVATQVPNFNGFPLGVTAGSYTSPLCDLSSASSFNSAFIAANGGTVAAAASAFENGMDSGHAYFNIHTSVNPGGEIRYFLRSQRIFANGFDG